MAVGRVVFRVSYLHDGGALSVQLGEQFHDLFGLRGVEISGWFVGQDDQRIIASGISDGIESGVFRPADPQRVAAFVANHINGIFFSSIMREDVDIAASMAELKQNLWLILDYDPTGLGTKI